LTNDKKDDKNYFTRFMDAITGQDVLDEAGTREEFLLRRKSS
jgi:hypothetical protein